MQSFGDHPCPACLDSYSLILTCLEMINIIFNRKQFPLIEKSCNIINFSYQVLEGHFTINHLFKFSDHLIHSIIPFLFCLSRNKINKDDYSIIQLFIVFFSIITS